MFVVNILSMSILIKTMSSLTELRAKFRRDIFERLTDKDSNFLLKVTFYLLKYLHLFVLPSIFLFSLTGINLYFVGLLYFSLRYISSLQAYRKSGRILLIFTAFFIWIKYLWEYAREDFVSSFLKNYGNLVKLLDMLTFTEVKQPVINPNSVDPNGLGN